MVDLLEVTEDEECDREEDDRYDGAVEVDVDEQHGITIISRTRCKRK